MKDKILNLLEERKVAITLEDIVTTLDINDIEELNKVIKELEEEGVIYKTNKGKYVLLKYTDFYVGRFRSNPKGFGFVKVDGIEKDVHIDEKNVDGAIFNDIVLIEILSRDINDNENSVEGKIVRVVKRPYNTYVGEINFDKKNKGHIKLDDKKVLIDIIVKKEDSLNSVDGHKVVVELEEKVDKNRYYGKVIEIIGHKNDPGVDILSICYKYKIHTEFSSEIKDFVKDLPNSVKEEEYANRLDLRDEIIFTIDGDDTKDIDDAISIDKLNNGHYKLGVHIADVSHYVTENSILDLEAQERGTSVYLADRVIPMLPHELSNGICSLNPNVDRLAVSCFMEFDGEGNKLNYDVKLSVINSKKQMTYKNVNKILEKNEVPEGYFEFVDKLKLMQELSEKISKAMVKRGYIDFDIDEAKVIVDVDGKAIDVVKRDRGKGEKLIENFMISANESVASLIYFMNLPFVYRIHELPQEDKIRGFSSFLQSLGYSINIDLSDLRPKNIQKLLDFIKEKKESKMLSALLLRSMKKAIYSPVNLGHYALASKCYTHFTSPIRRYPDTTVHRLLHYYLFDGNISAELVSSMESKLNYICEHSSLMERTSVDCEREVDEMKMAEYMEDHVGEEFTGEISSVTNFGLFIMLDNLIEGLVPIDDMNDYYVYDEKLLTLTGQRSNTKYRLGDKVKVKCVRASKEESQIDFEILKKI